MSLIFLILMKFLQTQFYSKLYNLIYDSLKEVQGLYRDKNFGFTVICFGSL